ncbi:hypothetical protein CgunFtcFv8_026454 [Champsocephalus gunnari]|uniref:Uncharacterized protein n=1 Tax=Champsocephalus gunnari TaxID=52237 RepID=A0AAN8DXI6_CHAGU|nr:hypothetical protein CgunFtcFv8_026454 [Champsocephalus gunnari]
MTVIFFILNQVSDGPWLWGAYTLQVHSGSGWPTLCRSTVLSSQESTACGTCMCSPSSSSMHPLTSTTETFQETFNKQIYWRSQRARRPS